MPDSYGKDHYRKIAELNRPGVEGRLPAEIDTTVPSVARVYDYILGGKDNWPADRAMAEKIIEQMPDVAEQVVANRDFLRRSVNFMANRGIRQFIDLGTGIPTMGPTHEVAQAVDPDARVVYVDNDPIVLTHARALLRGGATVVRQHDIREPRTILNDPRIFGEQGLMDLREPVGLLFIAVLHFVEDAQTIVDTLLRELPGGSYVAISHVIPERKLLAAATNYQQASAQVTTRTPKEIAELLHDTEIVEPGVVPVADWHPDTENPPKAKAVYAGVGRTAPVSGDPA